MHGMGCPYGVTEEGVPLAGKVYKVIRANEALQWHFRDNPQMIIPTLQEWSR